MIGITDNPLNQINRELRKYIFKVKINYRKFHYVIGRDKIQIREINSQEIAIILENANNLKFSN